MLFVTKTAPSANGQYLNLTLPTSIFGVGATAHGCLLAQTQFGASTSRRVFAQGGIHQIEDGAQLVAAISGANLRFDLDPNANTYWPASARRVFLRFDIVTNNTAGTNTKPVVVSVTDLVVGGTVEVFRTHAYIGTGSAETITFCCWVNLPPKINPNQSAWANSIRVNVNFTTGSAHSASSTMRCLAWSSART
jgi:hypothetical protein